MMKTRALTLGDVKEALAPYPVKVKRTSFGEYAVTNGIQAAIYFTDDLEDAFKTAFNMLGAKG